MRSGQVSALVSEARYRPVVVIELNGLLTSQAKDGDEELLSPNCFGR